MTDTITPASLRATANWWADRFTEHDSFDLVRDVLNREAARLEAESDREEEAEKLAEVYRVAFKAAAGDSYIADGSWAVTGIRAVLDRLAADGRLLPEGGTDLLPCDRCNGSGSEPAGSAPDSGPDGTPEKPWPTRCGGEK